MTSRVRLLLLPLAILAVGFRLTAGAEPGRLRIALRLPWIRRLAGAILLYTSSPRHPHQDATR